MIEGGAGDDLIDGGPGQDTAVFSGANSDYRIVASERGVQVVDSKDGRDGTDTLRKVERLRFSDREVDCPSPGGR